MTQLNKKAKESIIQQALQRDGLTMKDIAVQNNIGQSTLSRWIRHYKVGKPVKARGLSKISDGDSKDITADQKFQHILNSHFLTDLDLGRYCRTQGIFSHELQRWREDFMVSLSGKVCLETHDTTKAELKEMRKKYSALEQDIQRKDKALAEASALLILKKKPT